jgi:hypothetical protein
VTEESSAAQESTAGILTSLTLHLV